MASAGVTAALSLLLTVLLLHSPAHAHPGYLKLIPNGDAHSRPGSGITCEQLGHTPCEPGKPRNAFGLDFRDAGRKWTKELCEMDSDGDGVSNGQELGDPCCTWTPDNDAPLRLTMLSHPGDASEDGAKDAPGCQTGGTDPPTVTSTTLETTTTETTTTDVDTSTTTETTTTDVDTTTTTETTTTELPTTTTTETTTTDVDTSTTTETTTTDVDTTTTIGPSTTTATTTAPTTTTTTTTTADSDPVCFPAHATVRLEGGPVKTMSELRLGDRVQVAPDQYSPVFLFTHRLRDVTHEFVTIRAGSAGEVRLALTKGHFLYVNGNLAPAETVVVGDELELVSGERSLVVEVACAMHKGLYNPQTEHGDLIVDAVRVSTYTTAIQPATAHSMLAPLRVLYRIVGWSTSAFEAGADRILALVQ